MSLNLAVKPFIRLDLDVPRLASGLVVADPADPGRKPAEDFAALQFFDADISLRSAEYVAGPLLVRNVAARAQVSDGRVILTLAGARVADGEASGLLTFAAGPGGTLQRSLKADLRNIKVLGLLADLAQVRTLDGALSASLDLQSSGWSGGETLRTAAGTLSVTADGMRATLADLPPFLAATARQLPALKPDGNGTVSVFDRVAATLRIRDGKATADDITASGPVVAASGGGSVDLEAGTVALRFEPRLVQSGRLMKGVDLRVPVMVEGPILSPRIYPDLGAMAASGGTLSNLGALGDLAIGAIVDALTPPDPQRAPARPRRDVVPPSRPR